MPDTSVTNIQAMETETNTASAVFTDPSIDIGTLLVENAPAKLDLQKLIAGRMIIQGISGAGKSWTLRKLLEESYGMIQQIVFDPEGEFAAFAEHFNIQRVELAGVALDLLPDLAQKIRRHRISVVFDFQKMNPVEQMQASCQILETLIAEPVSYWFPVLMAIDEAHVFAPQVAGHGAGSKERKDAVAAMTSLASRGRKRGIASVLATHRLAKVNTSVTSECANALIGQNSHLTDIKRAADIIGWEMARAESLRDMAPGTFVGIGPALFPFAQQLKIGGTITENFGRTPGLLSLPEMSDEEIADILQLDALANTAAAAADPTAVAVTAKGSTNMLARFLLQPSSPLATSIIKQLTTVSPNAVEIGNLRECLAVEDSDFEAAMSLLEYHQLIERNESEDIKVVRLALVARRLMSMPTVARLVANKS